MMISTPRCTLPVLFWIASSSHAFTTISTLTPTLRRRTTRSLLSSFTEQQQQQPLTFSPIFDFGIESTIESFDRIDDAIMGGISTSALRNAPGKPYAIWSGICREDGGGFCGTRTLPFRQPLQVGDAEGLYMDCRLVSDNEPERRVWKISTRTEASRGEELFQSQCSIPKTTTADDEWARVLVPFANFTRVRGARFVEGASSMNVTGGIYQIGVTMSKFVIAQNMTSLQNFRPGYFELNLKEIGLYSRQPVQVDTPATLSTDEVKQKRTILLKVIFALSKTFFSEQANRRKSAMSKLTQKRHLSRPQAILFGIRLRASKSSLIGSMVQAVGIIGTDVFRAVVGYILRYGILKPVQILTTFKKTLQGEKKNPSATTLVTQPETVAVEPAMS